MFDKLEILDDLKHNFKHYSTNAKYVLKHNRKSTKADDSYKYINKQECIFVYY